jgi:hypothetical protein
MFLKRQPLDTAFETAIPSAGHCIDSTVEGINRKELTVIPALSPVLKIETSPLFGN